MEHHLLEYLDFIQRMCIRAVGDSVAFLLPACSDVEKSMHFGQHLTSVARSGLVCVRHRSVQPGSALILLGIYQYPLQHSDSRRQLSLLVSRSERDPLTECFTVFLLRPAALTLRFFFVMVLVGLIARYLFYVLL